MTHKYWGNVEEDWAGYSSDITFSNSFFEKQNIEIFLGEEFDEDGEEIEEPPTEKQLDEFAATYQNFIENIESNIKNIQDKAFERYQKLYAHFYENPEKSGDPALNIDDVDKHNYAIKEIMFLRVLDEKTIKLSIRYELDTEHGIEFRFEDGKITAVGGIAEA
ncbi:DUF6985 domain-containing protein [Flavobacterium hercynium]|uniref:DUF6985 domain-containing protein n=1 Tax=Flavobacterium hercynium TaxID=387094 RepID=A0A226GX86_9FLAO|nr:hypothetical protein [Flavobacterium hercynium]OXA86603.1 hypothetical protein B0A66_17540 [Flavobacterium hercynium]SMP25364.1 hypothetical protein SAMN06265346_108246 [Flavobacterium hercynium]